MFFNSRLFALFAGRSTNALASGENKDYVPTMKIIPHLVLVSSVLLVMVSPQKGALAGNCGTTGCNLTYVAPYVPRATPASHGFTAIGGSRVADINLSQEARDGINAGIKEAPLPRGFLTAADRGKLIVKQPPLYGWPQNGIPRRPLWGAQLHDSGARRVWRNTGGSGLRSLAGPVKPVTAVKVAIAAKARE